jgi:hypothetical protein
MLLDFKSWGTRGVLLFTTIAVVVSLFVVNVLIANVADVTPTSNDTTVIVEPSSGSNVSFDLLKFCNDPMTTGKFEVAPDASGATYTLTRGRDSKPETVRVLIGVDGKINVDFSTRYWFEGNEQKSEQVFITEDARKCIEKKG